MSRQSYRTDTYFSIQREETYADDNGPGIWRSQSYTLTTPWGELAMHPGRRWWTRVGLKYLFSWTGYDFADDSEGMYWEWRHQQGKPVWAAWAPYKDATPIEDTYSRWEVAYRRFKSERAAKRFVKLEPVSGFAGLKGEWTIEKVKPR